MVLALQFELTESKLIGRDWQEDDDDGSPPPQQTPLLD
jgi:hypothetical protein